MAMSYTALKEILACDLFDGRLEKFGVCEISTTKDNEKQYGLDGRPYWDRCLLEGDSCVYVSIDLDGTVTTFTASGASDPRKILNAVAKAFQTNMVSEDDPRFWGFSTEEDWAPLRDKIESAIEDQFYSELLKRLHGEANDIAPQSFGMQMAEIAKRLVAVDPNLLLPGNKNRLLSAISKIYECQTDKEKMAGTRTIRKDDERM